jgi:hypothetical protein
MHPQTCYDVKTKKNCDFDKRGLLLTHIHMKTNSDKGRIRKLKSKCPNHEPPYVHASPKTLGSLFTVSRSIYCQVTASNDGNCNEYADESPSPQPLLQTDVTACMLKSSICIIRFCQGMIFVLIPSMMDRLCSLVVRVLSYRSRGPG